MQNSSSSPRRHSRHNHTSNHTNKRRSRGTTYHTKLPPICGGDVETAGAGVVPRGLRRPGGAGRRQPRMRSANTVSQQQESSRQQLPKRRERPAGATALMYACQQGRDSHVRELLKEKPGCVEIRDRSMKSALHYCAENATPASAELVLAAAPELLDSRDEDGFTALHLAVIAGNVALVRFLLSRRADLTAMDNESHSVVHWATVCGEVEALDALLVAGAVASSPDIHGGYPIHYAAQMCGVNSEMGNDVKVGLAVLRTLLARGIDVNVTDKDGRQPVLWAASAGSADAVLALVNAGANVEADDKDGLTALHCAASRGHTECLETLVTLCGAEVNVIDSNGCTALFYAVTLGHADCTQLLLNFGAEPNRQDRKGRTAAHCGAAKGQLETLRLLGASGADLWSRNVRGDLPLHEAVQSGRRELVRWLLAQRPDVINTANNDGRSALHIAAVNNNTEMCKVVLDAQSLVNPVMRGAKGQLMTPLDAALLRGNRGCAKYLQLHGGVPASKLTEEAAAIRGSQRSESQQGGATTPAMSEGLSPRPELLQLAGFASASPSPRGTQHRATSPVPALSLQVPPSDQMTQTHEEMFREKAEASSATRVSSSKSRRVRPKKSASQVRGTPSSSDSEDGSEVAPPGSAAEQVKRRRAPRGSSKRHVRGKRKVAGEKHSDVGPSGEESPARRSPASTESPHKSPRREKVTAEVHQQNVDQKTVINTQTTENVDSSKNTSISESNLVDSTENKIVDVNLIKKVEIKEETEMQEKSNKIVTHSSELKENQNSSKVEVITGNKTSDGIVNKNSQIKDKISVDKGDNDAKVQEKNQETEDFKVEANQNELKKSNSKENGKSESRNRKNIGVKFSESSEVTEKRQGNKESSSTEQGPISGTVADQKKSLDQVEVAEDRTAASEEAKTSRHVGDSSCDPVKTSMDVAKEKDTKSTEETSKALGKSDNGEEEILNKNLADRSINKVNDSLENKEQTDGSTNKVNDSLENKEQTEGITNKVNSGLEYKEQTEGSTNKVNGSQENKEETEGITNKINDSQENKEQTEGSTNKINGSQENKEQTEGIANKVNDSQENEEQTEGSTNKIKGSQEKKEQTEGIANKVNNSQETKKEEIEHDKNEETEGKVVNGEQQKISSSLESEASVNKNKEEKVGHEVHKKSKENGIMLSDAEDIYIIREGVTAISHIDTPTSKRTRRKSERTDSDKQATSNSEKDEMDHADREISDGTRGKRITTRTKPSTKQKPLAKVNKNRVMDTKMEKEARNKARKTNIKSSEEESHSLKSSEQHSSLEEPIEGETSESSTRSKAADSGVMIDSGFVPSNNQSPKPRHRVRQSRPTGASKSVAASKLAQGAGAQRQVVARPRGGASQERRLELRSKTIAEDELKAREIIRQRQEQSVVSVTQAVQVSTRKYQLERRIFQELLDLKRLQIRAARGNEQVLVKRAVDEYRRAGLIVGLRQYDGPYSFRAFEHYLYDQLRVLQHQSADSRMVARLKPSDDVESLSAALRRSLPGGGPHAGLHHTAAFCTLGTHRCNHATDAYTGVPVAAYVSRPSPLTLPRSEGGFLPRIEPSASKSGRTSATAAGTLPPRSARGLHFVDPRRPVTLELSHGGERQVISLPTERLDRTKRYYVTFTIKPGDGATATAQPTSTENRHRHAKSL